jgi:hypothetical protein
MMQRMFARQALLSLFCVTAVITACGGGDPPTRTPAGGLVTCRADADCVLTDHTSCNRCCASNPLALPKDKHERQQNLCAAVDMEPCAPNIECPKVAPLSQYVAKCKEGTCAAVKAN